MDAPRSKIYKGALSYRVITHPISFNIYLFLLFKFGMVKYEKKDQVQEARREPDLLKYMTFITRAFQCQRQGQWVSVAKGIEKHRLPLNPC